MLKINILVDKKTLFDQVQVPDYVYASFVHRREFP